MEHFLFFSLVLTLITLISILLANPEKVELKVEEENEDDTFAENLSLEIGNTRSSNLLIGAPIPELLAQQRKSNLDVPTSQPKPKGISEAERAPSPSAPELPGSSKRSNIATRINLL